MDKNRYYLDGPGEVLIMASDFNPAVPDLSKIISSVSCKSASIGGSVEMEPVTGGRSLSPRRKFLKGRENTFEMEDCEMDFRYHSLAIGENEVVGVTTVWAFGEDFSFTVPAGAVVALGQTPIADTITVQLADGTELTAGDPATNVAEYSLAAAAMTVHTDHIGATVITMFQYETAATAREIATLNTSLPKTVKIVHKQPTFDADNAITGYQYVEIYKAQTSAEFEQAYQEKAAYAPKLKFDILDPKRGDKKLMKTTWEAVA